MKIGISIVGALLLLSACSSGGGSSGARSGSLTAPAKSYVKVGKPYSVRGVTYYPAHQPDYDVVGEASWYGPGFHGQSTANGEVYNKWDLTAAHPTLPLPSLVKVTHLKNGREVVVRINDRGPFANGRIIDLSRGAAEKLGMLQEGVARVRVRYLPEETNRLLQYVQAGRRPFEINVEEEVLKPVARAHGAQPGRSFAGNNRANTQVASNANVAPKRSFWQKISLVGDAHAEEIAPPKVISSSELPPLGAKPASAPISAPATKAGEPSVYDVLKQQEPNTSAAVLPAPVSAPAPVPVPVLSAKSAAISPAAAGGHYVVRLGTFSERARAEKLSGRLAGKPIKIEQVMVKDRVLYRTSAGPFTSKAQADRTVAEAFDLGLKDAYISRN